MEDEKTISISLERICLGHLNPKKLLLGKLDKEPYCWKCGKDENNTKCRYYHPIKITIYEFSQNGKGEIK